MLVWQRRTLAGSGSRPGIARSRVGAEAGERLVDGRLLLAAEADRVVATVGHRGGVDDLAVHVRAVQEAGEPRAGLAHAEGSARVELDGERDLETEARRSARELSAGTQDRPFGGPHALGRVELDPRVPLAHPNTRARTSRSPRLPARPSMAARTSIEPPSSSRSASSSGGSKTGSAPTCSSRPTRRAGTPAASNAAARSATFGPQMRTPSRPSSRAPSSPSSRSHSARARTASRTSRSSSCPCRKTRVRPADCPDPGAAASKQTNSTPRRWSA